MPSLAPPIIAQPPQSRGASPEPTPEMPRCLSPGDLPAHIKSSYRAFALVTEPAHVDLLDPADEEILIICCDWMMWHRLSAESRHVVYYGLGALDWTEPDSLEFDLFHRANDWLLDLKDGDPTLFHGVSLGRTFGAEISFSSINYYRIERSLRPLIKRFSPDEIWFYDFKSDLNIFSAETRTWIVQSIARECGVAFCDKGENLRNDSNADEEAYVPKQHGWPALLVLAIYSWGLETVSRLRCLLSPGDRRVLLLVVSNTAEPLAREFRNRRFTPIFLGRTIPKNFLLLWNCLRQGVLLVRPLPTALSKKDGLRLAEIRTSLERVLAEPATGVLGFVRTLVRRQFLDSGKLEEHARSVLMEERLLDRYRPRRLVVDGVRNLLHLINIELAKSRHIHVDYTWHSPLTPQTLGTGALGGDPRQPVFVDRCLSWGPINDAWLDRVDAKQPRAHVGCPIADRYRTAASPARTENSRKAPGETKILFLLYTFTTSDLNGLQHSMYATFVDGVRMLNRLGYTKIGFKMHPAPGRWKKSLIEDIARYFGIECEIWKSQPFSECLDWADIVIGPMQTGAFFETLAAGKPYYPLLIPPYSHDPTFYPGYPYYESLDELAEALEGSPPTSAMAKTLLNDMYSVEEFASTASRFWDVIEGDFK